MSDFNQENYYLPENQNYQSQELHMDDTQSRQRPGSADFFSLPARIGMWFVGVIVGLTLIFACGIFWAWGLEYIGLIDTGRNNASQSDGSNSQGGSDYSEFEDFYDYFGGYFGNMPSGGESQDGQSQTQPTPGIGVTIRQIQLDFIIDDTYSAGLVIEEINEKGALAGTEAKVGDLIVAVNGQPCPTMDALDVFLQQTGIGGEMVMTLARYTNGVASTFEVPITLIDINSIN